jgi:hypothetical protein
MPGEDVLRHARGLSMVICVLMMEQELQQVDYIATIQRNTQTNKYIWRDVCKVRHEALQLERRYVKGRLTMIGYFEWSCTLAVLRAVYCL